MNASFLNRSFRFSLAAVVTITAALLLSAPASAQHAERRIPPGTHGYEAFQIRQEQDRLNAARPSTPNSTATNGRYTAPTDRTYAWYAPPAEYEVIRTGTPEHPEYVTVTGEDGTPRTFRLEGPVVVHRNVVALRPRAR